MNKRAECDNAAAAAILLYLCLVQKASGDFEVVIVGAGPAGATCGYFLGMSVDITVLTVTPLQVEILF